MAPKQNFRALIQNVGLSKVKNSPKQRIHNIVKKSHQNELKNAAAAGAGSKAASSMNGDTAESADSFNDSIEGVKPTQQAPSQSPISSYAGAQLPSNNAASSTDKSDATKTLIEKLQRLRIDADTTANVRDKMQQAFHAGVHAYEKFLASAARTLDTSTTPHATPEDSKPKAAAAATAAAASPSSPERSKEGAAAFYLDKMQSTFEEAKRYYSAVPFDQRWDDILSSLAVLGRTSRGNRVVPYHDSAKAFLGMWAAVDDAKHRTCWQTYICKDDFIGQTTVHKLAQAHQRGCDTELLYDSGGNISGRARLTEELKQCGAKVITYRPFFRSVFTYFVKGLDWKRSPGLRNHRKILLVDANTAFCGGLNVGNEYCGKAAGGTGKFRDTHCGVVGPAAAHLAEVYRDTKQPHPWKYGWRRWRQIASNQITRRMKVGRARMERNELYQAFQAERKRSGRRLQDVPSASMKVIKGRWQKQKDQLRTLMHWTRQGTTDADLDQEAVKASGAAAKDDDGRQTMKRKNTTAALTPEHTTTVPSPAEDEAPLPPRNCATQDRSTASAAASLPSRAQSTTAAATTPQSPSEKPPATASGAAAATAAQPGDAAYRRRAKLAHSGNGKTTAGPKTSAMRRKLMAARRDALYRATDLPHKRAYTDLLRRMPLLDTEPVPEAEMYFLRATPVTQILSCNPRFRDYSIQYAFWQVTRKCHRRIWITTPYYLPTRKLFTALIQAAHRGVDVRLLSGSNQTTDPWFMWHASNYITQRLLSAGVKIYEFKGEQIMHAKTVVVDSMWSSIGSYNWDLMSNRNLEVCLCHLDLDVAKDMEAQFLRDLSESVEVHLEDHKQRSLWLRFTSWFFYNVVFLLDRITFRSFSSEDVVDVPGVPRS